MAGRAADRGGPRRMGGWSAADERMGHGGWAAADGSRQIADGSARALDASVIAGAGQSSRGGYANPPCEPGSWAGRDGDEASRAGEEVRGAGSGGKAPPIPGDGSMPEAVAAAGSGSSLGGAAGSQAVSNTAGGGSAGAPSHLGHEPPFHFEIQVTYCPYSILSPLQAPGFWAQGPRSGSAESDKRFECFGLTTGARLRDTLLMTGPCAEHGTSLGHCQEVGGSGFAACCSMTGVRSCKGCLVYKKTGGGASVGVRVLNLRKQGRQCWWCLFV